MSMAIMTAIECKFCFMESNFDISTCKKIENCGWCSEEVDTGITETDHVSSFDNSFDENRTPNNFVKIPKKVTKPRSMKTGWMNESIKIERIRLHNNRTGKTQLKWGLSSISGLPSDPERLRVFIHWLTRATDWIEVNN